MADVSLDSRRLAREQENNLTEFTNFGIGMAKPLAQYQMSILRLWVDSFGMFVNNIEKNFAMFDDMLEQRAQPSRRQG